MIQFTESLDGIGENVRKNHAEYMKIYYCDKDIIVCIKPSGAVSTDEPGGMPELIREAIGHDKQVRAVHRLDSIVSGLMVYALSKESASGLSRQISDGSFIKEYFAVLEGHPLELQGNLHDLLFRNQKKRKTYVVEKEGKNVQNASLSYQVCQKSNDLSLVRIKLHTGRTHQIRAQFSSRALPLYGDTKYGSLHKEIRIALWSCHLSFTHPVTGKEMDFFALPPDREPWTAFPEYHTAYEEQDLISDYKRSPSFSDCPNAYACDVCAYQGMDYSAQLEKKKKYCSKWLRKYADITSIAGSDIALHYKNKMTVTFFAGKSGEVLCGFYSKANRRMLCISSCLLNHSIADEIFDTIRELAMVYHLQPFDEKKKTGCLRQAEIRRSRKTGELLLILRTVSADKKQLFKLSSELTVHFPKIRSVVLENDTMTGAHGGKSEEQVLLGSGYIEEELCGSRFRMTACSFFPANVSQTENMYRTAITLAALTGNERILDIGCGNGVFSITASKSAKRIIGIDFHRDAIHEAQENAALNVVQNTRFICTEPENYLAALVRSHEKIDVIFIDSIRSRISTKCIELLSGLKPNRIIYISGNPEALAKDLDLLTKTKYKVMQIEPFDSLPFTEYVENVVLLRNESAFSTI